MKSMGNKRFLSLIIGLVSILSISAQTDLTYYLPDIKYDQNIPTPQSVLDYQIGEWHITHDQLVRYMTEVCESSPNCQLSEIGRTHEHRPLLNLVISSQKNLSNLEDLVEKHAQLIDPAKSHQVNIDETPMIIYQGYSIHGNESSGSNSCPLVTYYLLAGQSDFHDQLLDDVIIVIDPSYNPDGLQRFSTWANSHKHHHLVSDPLSREFNEVWPGGRTNHYWFDLNRDWIFNIHPSSKARIESFHKWKPDILTDHHEMGSNSTFFFQPGVPSRTNPNTPAINQMLTEEIGNYHASALDSIGSLYFSKERYDDFYYGKGSTYPDINGCIGILFEQASARGHLRETSNGLLSFPFSIRNQVTTSLSTQKAALNMKQKILEYKRDFYKSRYDNTDQGYYIFSDKDDYKLDYFLTLLNRHQIKVYQAPKSLKVENQNFDQSSSYVVPKKQIQGSLVKTIFERVRTFPDSIFYDVSAWTLPLAFNMKYAESKDNLALNESDLISTYRTNKSNKAINPKSYAILLDWNNYNTPKVVYKLLESEIQIKTITENTELKINGKLTKVDKGSILIPLKQQDISKDSIINLVTRLCTDNNISTHVLQSGLSPSGRSLGGGIQKNIEQPKAAMIVGSGVNAYEAGSTWYQMDQRLEMPVVMLDKNQIRRAELSKFNIIIMPDGNYDPDDDNAKKIKKWVDNGGTLLAMRRAIDFLSRSEMIKTEPNLPKGQNKSKANGNATTLQNYRGAQVIGGAIFQSKIDLNHPLFYGYKEDTYPVFKKGTQFLKVTNTLATPMVYTDKPIMSGYASKQNIAKAKNAAGIICAGHGKGRIIAMVDNPNFRGYWLGGSQLFANTLFFHNLIDRSTLQQME